MSLMKFAPETVRLRRVAKAHSLGEFSVVEYRRARREVIENFDVHSADDDDTQPRMQPADQTRFEPHERAAPKTVRTWLAWLLAAVTLLVATQLLAAQDPAGGVYIGSAAERDPNPATSPRLTVANVVLSLPEELSLGGLDGLEGPGDSAALQTVIDSKLAEIRLRNQPGGHGFTESELLELGRLLNALGAHDREVELSARDAADLSALLQDQKGRRGISVLELEEIAAAVQDHVRAAGYFLAVSYVPAQTVREGQVEIGLLPGVLGEVRVSESGGKLADRFKDLVGRPVTAREINTRLYALNQAPGFSARASFEPGSEVGETRLNLDVLEQSSMRGTFSIDNHGDEHTGKQRLVLGGDLINPAGRGDVLRIGLTAAIDPSNQLLGFVEYATPVGSRRQLRGRLARNDFSTGNATSGGEIDGQGWLLDGVLETYLYRDRLTGLSWELGIGRHDLSWQTPIQDIDQQVNLLSAALNARRVWDDSQIAADLRLYADAGSISGDTFAGQDDQFWDLGFDLFGWHPFDAPFLPGRQKASLQLRGQLASTQLPSSRRLALGGVGASRGFERDIYLADRGMLLRADLRTPLKLGELVLFADAAYGKDRNSLTPGWAHVANLGISWDVVFAGHVRSSISWALPITAKGTGGLDDEGTTLFWSLRYVH